MDEVGGAVQRVDQPHPAGLGEMTFPLLTDYGIARPAPADHVEDRLFGTVVDCGDRIGLAFEPDLRGQVRGA